MNVRYIFVCLKAHMLLLTVPGTSTVVLPVLFASYVGAILLAIISISNATLGLRAVMYSQKLGNSKIR